MPAMPPAPEDEAARVVAVRQTIRLATTASLTGGMIGMAPKGGDVEGGQGPLPPGAGKFMALMVQAGLPVLPVGVGEIDGRLKIEFGPCLWPEIPASRAARD